MLSVIVPENAALELPPDPLLALSVLRQCRTRKALFYDENFSAYVVHTTAKGEVHPPTTTVTLVPQRGQSSLDLAASNKKTGPGQTAVVDRPLVHGVVGSERVLIWKFQAAPTGAANDSAGLLKFFVKGQKLTLEQVNGKAPSASSDPSAELTTSRPPQLTTSRPTQLTTSEATGTSPGSSSSLLEPLGRPVENLLEELNHHVVASPNPRFEFYGNPAPEEPPAPRPLTPAASPVYGAVLEVATINPVSLKLRTTKLRGKTNTLVTTLRIEASLQIVDVVDNFSCYVLELTSLHVLFKAGAVETLGHMAFPHRLASNEILCVAYKLTNYDMSEEQVAVVPLDVRVGLRLERQDKSSPQDSVSVTQQLVTTWNPFLEFGTHTKAPYAAAHSQSQPQFRSKSGAKPFKKPSGALSTALLESPFSPNPQGQTTPQAQMPRASPGMKTRKKVALAHMLSQNLVPSSQNLAPSISQNLAVSPVASTPANARGLTISLGCPNPGLAGLRLTFLYASNVEVGRVSTWRVQAVNTGTKTWKLWLILAKRPQVPQIGFFTESPAEKLVAQYQALRLERTGVIVLSSDIVLGRLEPGQVVETEMRLLGLQQGSHFLLGLRVFDSLLGELADFGRMLEVFVV